MENAWLKLDNAAKLYPAKVRADDTCVYRVYVILKEAVRPDLLYQSVCDLKPRFPTFYVQLRNGFFWNHYEPNERSLIVSRENGDICALMDGHGNNGYLFAVRYDQCRISLEAFHALGDGCAAIQFLNALVYRYLTLAGHRIHPMNRVATVEQQPSPAEMEDSYTRYYTGAQKRATGNCPAYQIRGTAFSSPNECGVMHGLTDTAELLDAAHRYHTTVTKYLTALLVRSIWLAGAENPDIGRLPICINVPVDMRKRLPSQTLRNFSLFFTARMGVIETLPPMPEIIAVLDREFQTNADLDALRRLLNANVSVEKTRLITWMPLAIKQIVIGAVAAAISENHLTTSMSNLGELLLPDAMAPLIDHYGVIPPLGNDIPVIATAISACGQTEITFVRKIRETDVERHFFKQLARDGAEVTLTTNRPE